MSRDHLKSHVGFYKSRYRGYILYESEGIIYLDRITINEGLRFNVKKSHDFLCNNIILNFDHLCLIIRLRFNHLTFICYLYLV